MAGAHYELIGVGLYTLPEASRLTGVSSARIRRWTSGYTYRRPGEDGTIHERPPVWTADLPEIDGKRALTFLDLMEVRFVNAFLEAGVSWPTLRRTVEEARRLLNARHPFSSHRFLTDGRAIFAEIATASGQQELLDIARSQFAFRQVISPSLKAGLEFSDDNEIVRWWPLGRARQIVLDPKRSFGRPIVDHGSVPTTVLAAAVQAEGEGAIVRVAKWFGVSRHAVSAAVDYEQKLAA